MSSTLTKPRLGFLGVGWIGANRLDAFVASDAGTVAAIADADVGRAHAIAEQQGCPVVGASIDEVLAADVDGIVIATPSALHAEQCVAALRAGVPVFCQKPLARTAREADAVVEEARRRDLLLGVDMSYRHVRAFAAAEAALRDSGGEIYALELRFHNAYGPDKPWFTDPARSGGGCVIDLGTHLLDLAMWWLQQRDLRLLAARLYHQGRLLERPPAVAEDYAEVVLAAGSTTIRLACSWFLPLGVDASIQAGAYSPSLGVEVTNVDGSFYDFTARRHASGESQTLTKPPDDWGGRALCAWVGSLAKGRGFDDSVSDQVAVAGTIDEIYGRTR